MKINVRRILFAIFACLIASNFGLTGCMAGKGIGAGSGLAPSAASSADAAGSPSPARGLGLTGDDTMAPHSDGDIMGNFSSTERVYPNISYVASPGSSLPGGNHMESPAMIDLDSGNLPAELHFLGEWIKFNLGCTDVSCMTIWPVSAGRTIRVYILQGPTSELEPKLFMDFHVDTVADGFNMKLSGLPVNNWDVLEFRVLPPDNSIPFVTEPTATTRPEWIGVLEKTSSMGYLQIRMTVSSELKKLEGSPVRTDIPYHPALDLLTK